MYTCALVAIRPPATHPRPHSGRHSEPRPQEGGLVADGVAPQEGGPVSARPQEARPQEGGDPQEGGGVPLPAVGHAIPGGGLRRSVRLHQPPAATAATATAAAAAAGVSMPTHAGTGGGLRLLHTTATAAAAAAGVSMPTHAGTGGGLRLLHTTATAAAAAATGHGLHLLPAATAAAAAAGVSMPTGHGLHLLPTATAAAAAAAGVSMPTGAGTGGGLRLLPTAAAAAAAGVSMPAGHTGTCGDTCPAVPLLVSADMPEPCPRPMKTQFQSTFTDHCMRQSRFVEKRVGVDFKKSGSKWVQIDTCTTESIEHETKTCIKLHTGPYLIEKVKPSSPVGKKSNHHLQLEKIPSASAAPAG